MTINLRTLVSEKFTDSLRCYGHCNEFCKLRFLPHKDMLIVCHVCSSCYVSKIIAYQEELDVPKLRSTFSEILSELQEVLDADIRIATRYSWDVGLEDFKEGKVLTAAYWVQNYRRARSDDSNRRALFLCSQCGSTFVDSLKNESTLCRKCRDTA